VLSFLKFRQLPKFLVDANFYSAQFALGHTPECDVGTVQQAHSKCIQYTDKSLVLLSLSLSPGLYNSNGNTGRASGTNARFIVG
jgi:hypothetical protein